jgi:protease PrsW
VLVLALGAVMYEAARWAVEATHNPRLVPTLILLGAAVVPVSVLAVLLDRRPVSGVSGAVVGLTASLGGVVGLLSAGAVEYDTRRDLGALPLIAVGLIEELAKLLVPAVVLVVLRRRTHPADGLLLGVASGAGFAVLETMGYAFVAVVRSSGNLAAVNELLLDRGLASPAAHLAWTGVAAAALWRAAADQWRGRAMVRFVGAYLLVAVLHAGWDGAPNRWPVVGVALISLALLTWTWHRLGAADRRRPGGAPAMPASSARPPWRRHDECRSRTPRSTSAG